MTSEMEISPRPYTAIASKGCAFEISKDTVEAGMASDIPVNPIVVGHGMRMSLAEVKDADDVMR